MSDRERPAGWGRQPEGGGSEFLVLPRAGSGTPGRSEPGGEVSLLTWRGRTHPPLPSGSLCLLGASLSSPTGTPKPCSVAQSCLFATPWTAAHQASLSFTIP